MKIATLKTQRMSIVFQRSLHIANEIIGTIKEDVISPKFNVSYVILNKVKAVHYFAVSPEISTRAEAQKPQCNLKSKDGREGCVKDFE
jgi:hypothetical protein